MTSLFLLSLGQIQKQDMEEHQLEEEAPSEPSVEDGITEVADPLQKLQMAATATKPTTKATLLSQQRQQQKQNLFKNHKTLV